MFICDHQLYEVILTACTPKEEMEWCSRLSSGQNAIAGQDQEQTAAFSFLSLNLKSLGTVFRKPGTYLSPWQPLTAVTNMHQEPLPGGYQYTEQQQWAQSPPSAKSFLKIPAS